MLSKEEIEERGKELTKKYKGEYWKVADKEDFIWQWDCEKQTYVPEFNDKQL